MATYESAGIRRFALGRVDVIRSATPEALAWAKAMCQGDPEIQAGNQPTNLQEEGSKRVQFTIYSVTGTFPFFNDVLLCSNKFCVTAYVYKKKAVQHRCHASIKSLQGIEILLSFLFSLNFIIIYFTINEFDFILNFLPEKIFFSRLDVNSL